MVMLPKNLTPRRVTASYPYTGVLYPIRGEDWWSIARSCTALIVSMCSSKRTALLVSDWLPASGKAVDQMLGNTAEDKRPSVSQGRSNWTLARRGD